MSTLENLGKYLLPGAYASLHSRCFIREEAYIMVFNFIYRRFMILTLENLEVVPFGIHLFSRCSCFSTWWVVHSCRDFSYDV